MDGDDGGSGRNGSGWFDKMRMLRKGGFAFGYDSFRLDMHIYIGSAIVQSIYSARPDIILVFLLHPLG